ncbi:uncharacterized protein CELE_K08E7.4 [Caenorhabditis elegans]|uniref:Uncharacterized protein n=1 Tax=Caenorhabditis elegans TaxID=6239 RepID=Q21343_CAEEL|nr:Uncharacterized protein CELE_K08E7.4 [Caenorhabditis elegans]CAB01227.2 Uncharacterized protein CELE_K08E7.4 [Caenorhabditis elegans]|eukprot:NP_502408.2 Uncharacterized protein CELE_K08E7.4 [Caenorhabditis elegans]
MISQIILLLTLNILPFVLVHCGSKKKTVAPKPVAKLMAAPAGGVGKSDSFDSKKQDVPSSKKDEPVAPKKEDEGNYEELAIPQ